MSRSMTMSMGLKSQNLKADGTPKKTVKVRMDTQLKMLRDESLNVLNDPEDIDGEASLISESDEDITFDFAFEED